ncbi:type II secretion system F family protein [Demequina lignilytica]|uniref:Type II secretion system F family protein n=1 Tax=Demequina lignilytica TaxID=3051663 RepID=A0AB35MGX0_9MICO|nr:type II secretion system F family protein [Demequina sp. SYSU T0a273]MDN4483024.1 type II secretion system F family protein [Demequina sp. SYSU T0a273]
MTGSAWGIVGALGLGLALVWSWVAARRFSLERRLGLRRIGAGLGGATAAAQLAGVLRADALRLVARVAGPDRDVETRLQRAGVARTPDEHRARQLAHGAAGLGLGLVIGALVLGGGRSAVLGVVIALSLAAAGAALPDAALAWQARRRSARIRAELPVIAELLALAVVAGAGVTAALERIAANVGGVLGDELRVAVASARTGASVESALDQVATRTGDASVAVLVAAIVTAMERGTPLADVLHGQAAQVRERSRQRLMEDGGKREIAMLVPVVFVILPVTVVFAMYPGLAAIRLGS